MKKLEIEKTKPTFFISAFKSDIIIVGLLFSISNCFIAKTSLANNWRSFISSYLALKAQENLPFSQTQRLPFSKIRLNLKKPLVTLACELVASLVSLSENYSFF